MKIFDDNPSITYVRELNLTLALQVHDDNTILFGWSVCSQADNFSRKKGTANALARLRAVQKMLAIDPNHKLVQVGKFAGPMARAAWKKTDLVRAIVDQMVNADPNIFGWHPPDALDKYL